MYNSNPLPAAGNPWPISSNPSIIRLRRGLVSFFFDPIFRPNSWPACELAQVSEKPKSPAIPPPIARHKNDLAPAVARTPPDPSPRSENPARLAVAATRRDGRTQTIAWPRRLNAGAPRPANRCRQVPKTAIQLPKSPDRSTSRSVFRPIRNPNIIPPRIGKVGHFLNAG